MKNKTRWILIGVGLAAVAIGVVATRSGATIEVSTAVVRRDTLRAMVQEEGRTRVRDRFVVAAPTGGRLARIALDAGDWVAKGARVARVFPAPPDARDASVLRAGVTAAESRRLESVAQLRDAEQRGEQAARDAERSKALADSGAISPQAHEQIAMAAATAREQVEGASATLRAATADVAAARAALMGSSRSPAEGTAVAVSAPAAGRVLRVLERSERVVPAGTPLVEIGDAKSLEVVVDVLSDAAVHIPVAAPVRIDHWGGDTTLTGRVQRVEPNAFTKVSALGVEEQRVSVVVDLDTVPATLGAGYRVEAHIITWTGVDVIVVPTSALFQVDGEWRVFVAEGGRARLRSVRVGHRNADSAEILEGLRPSEVVIVFPAAAVVDGARVVASDSR